MQGKSVLAYFFWKLKNIEENGKLQVMDRLHFVEFMWKTVNYCSRLMVIYASMWKKFLQYLVSLVAGILIIPSRSYNCCSLFVRSLHASCVIECHFDFGNCWSTKRILCCFEMMLRDCNVLVSAVVVHTCWLMSAPHMGLCLVLPSGIVFGLYNVSFGRFEYFMCCRRRLGFGKEWTGETDEWGEDAKLLLVSMFIFFMPQTRVLILSSKSFLVAKPLFLRFIEEDFYFIQYNP